MVAIDAHDCCQQLPEAGFFNFKAYYKKILHTVIKLSFGISQQKNKLKEQNFNSPWILQFVAAIQASADQAQRHRPMKFIYHRMEYWIFFYTTYRNVDVRIYVYQ